VSRYVLSFRNPGVVPTAEQEAAWQAWFTEIGSHISDFGTRVQRAVMVGDASRGGDQLSGYVVIKADNIESAVQIANGCPGLAYGARVEVGETMPES
jgi:hypothetical protein